MTRDRPGCSAPHPGGHSKPGAASLDRARQTGQPDLLRCASAARAHNDPGRELVLPAPLRALTNLHLEPAHPARTHFPDTAATCGPGPEKTRLWCAADPAFAIRGPDDPDTSTWLATAARCRTTGVVVHADGVAPTYCLQASGSAWATTDL